jgi:predicted secreted protein
MPRSALLLAAPMFAALGVGCAGCHRESGPPNPSGSTVTTTTAVDDAASMPEATDGGETTVSAEDDGKTFDLSPGATLLFRLASRSGTGFVWKPAPLDGGVIDEVGDRTSEVSSAVPGAPKMDVYRFIARSVGTTKIEMSYERPWGNQPPVKTVRVTVNVR